MKYFIFSFFLIAACVSVLAFSGGSADVAITYAKTAVPFPGLASTVYVYNSGTSTVYCSFGDHIALATVTEYTPVASGASITLQDAGIAFMSFACATNEATVVDYGFVGD